jgi:hypothetical protein
MPGQPWSAISRLLPRPMTSELVGRFRPDEHGGRAADPQRRVARQIDIGEHTCGFDHRT